MTWSQACGSRSSNLENRVDWMSSGELMWFQARGTDPRPYIPAVRPDQPVLSFRWLIPAPVDQSSRRLASGMLSGADTGDLWMALEVRPSIQLRSKWLWNLDKRGMEYPQYSSDHATGAGYRVSRFLDGLAGACTARLSTSLSVCRYRIWLLLVFLLRRCILTSYTNAFRTLAEIYYVNSRTWARALAIVTASCSGCAQRGASVDLAHYVCWYRTRQ